MSLEIVRLALGPVSTNTYLVADPSVGKAAVIDPAWDGQIIIDEAKRLGWEIGHVWLTHAHFDHMGGVAVIADRVSPIPTIALHPDDYPLWRRQGDAAVFGFSIDPGPEPNVPLSHGQVLHLGQYPIEVRHAPGHTPGHVVFYCEKEKVLFSGDVLFKHAIGRTDLSDANYPLLLQSIRNQILTLPDETKVLPGHGPESTVGTERRENPFLR